MYVNFNILNQLGSPSLNSNTFANRPAAGQTGRLFISTDTFEIYRDNGTGWDLIGTGTGGGITGSGTANQVTYWTGSSAVGGESAFTYNPSTNALRVDGNVSLNRNADAWTPNNVFTVGNGSFTSDVGGTYLTFNAYYNVDWKYSQNGVASFYAQANGGHIWYNASSGTAGNNCSLTIAMYLDDNENLGVNGPPSSWLNTYKVVELPYGGSLYSWNSGQRIGLASNAFLSGGGSWTYTNTNTAQYYEMSAGASTWYNAASGTTGTAVSFTQRMTLTNNGFLSVHNSVGAWGSAIRGIQLGATASVFSSQSVLTTIGNNVYDDGLNFRYLITERSTRYAQQNSTHTFFTAASGSAGALITYTTIMSMPATGNVLIGTTTDGGQRLQVSGDSMLTGSGASSATTGLTVRDSGSVNLFRVRNDSGFLIGSSNNIIFYPANTSTGSQQTAGEAIKFDFNGTTNIGTATYFVISGLQLTATSNTYNIASIRRNFAPNSGTAIVNQMLIDPTVNQTGGANGITRGLYVNPTLTASADWRSVEMSNNSGWGIYQSGASANNYFNGDVLVGTTTDSGFKFDVNGSTRLNGTVRVDGQTAATAGGASGQHLIINCDGTTYKIALLNN